VPAGVGGVNKVGVRWGVSLRKLGAWEERD